MKNKYILAAMGAMMLYAGQAYAITQTQPMQVSLNNIASVTVSTTPINFGDVTVNTTNPTATGSITINATSAAPYTISIGAGQHSNTTGACRSVKGGGVSARRYQTYIDSAFTTAWGDSDTQATCATGTTFAGGGASRGGLGLGMSQTAIVYVQAFQGNTIGLLRDVLTVTVAY